MTDKRDAGGRFQTGNKGGGRPKGSRNKLGEAFLSALHDDFEEHGQAAIRQVREEKPDQYLKVVASILPKDLTLHVNPAEELSDDELRDRIKHLSEQLGSFLDDEGDAGAPDGTGTPPLH